MVHFGMRPIKEKHLRCTFQRQYCLRFLEESLTVGESEERETTGECSC